ncbi:exonuclease SbcCD subunit D [Shewanella glacialipiscicola]|uniref:Nuclease SbcCD subunit D n=1 Tax=Shewanella glacialipiscicola TaxID=614069 RepID=A0ABQ6J1H0_9GAMM|nr:exonuclease SbcCD subunit D [Shewanella glacialipiscicola]MCL1085338.1 exonuclease SbcCD subunit D [Shewanella glacialipiscicola]GIU05891.1 nuclease SbcCD subunit D [Shewanella glacialipiscicola]GMA81554.1 nuclease SbcCD subunit D [Shewanella glacialipiscicola]
MKFIHTSDWHIGRQLHNQSLLDDQAFVLEQIIALASEHKVDAVIVAGDIYDRSIPPANAVALLDDVLNRLVHGLGLQVIMIAGNHDGHERLGFAAKQMAASGLYIIGPLSAEVHPIRLSSLSGDVVFYPLPYADPATVRHVFECEAASHEMAMDILLEQVRKHDSQGLPKVVIGHCFLDGGSESESERPLSIGGADKISPTLFTEFDYVALGHLHGPQYKGAEHVRYSGSILKYSFSEQHQHKSVTLVELGAQTPLNICLLPLKSMRDVRILEGELEILLAQGKMDIKREDYLMVRLLDKHAILDAMGKLRAVYPNVLHLERTGLMAGQQQVALSRDHIKKGEMDMFCDFFSQVSGESLTQAQQTVMDDLLTKLHHKERQA